MSKFILWKWMYLRRAGLNFTLYCIDWMNKIFGNNWGNWRSDGSGNHFPSFLKVIFIIGCLHYKQKMFNIARYILNIPYNLFTFDDQACSTHSLAETSLVLFTSRTSRRATSTFPLSINWTSMCSLITGASALNKTTVLPTFKAGLFHKKALTIPVSSPKTTLSLFPTFSTETT